MKTLILVDIQNDFAPGGALAVARGEEVTLVGLATDYCVRFTALDAVREGFATRVIAAGCRAVDLEPGDGDRALEEMRDSGVEVV